MESIFKEPGHSGNGTQISTPFCLLVFYNVIKKIHIFLSGESHSKCASLILCFNQYTYITVENSHLRKKTKEFNS